MMLPSYHYRRTDQLHRRSGAGEKDEPPRMLTLCVKKVIKDGEEEKKAEVEVDEVQ